MTGIGWPLLEFASRLLETSEREAVLLLPCSPRRLDVPFSCTRDLGSALGITKSPRPVLRGFATSICGKHTDARGVGKQSIVDL
jgi:hypothetical protein